MRSTFSSWVSMAFVSLFLFLSGSASTVVSAQQLTASVQTDRGCGATAVYNIGESNSFLVSVSIDATVTLTLLRPDGTTRLIFGNQFLQGGVVYTIPGVIGNPPGQRMLNLFATAGPQSFAAHCAYTAQAVAVNPLTAQLTTNRGCGPTALFNIGNGATFTYSVSKTAQVTLRLLRPDGTVLTLVSGQTVPGGVPQTISSVIGNPTGQRRLILDAFAGSESTHLECTYSAQSTVTSITLSLSVDRGCGSTYHEGNAITFFYRASANATLTLFNQRADGTLLTVFANQPVLAGQTYSFPSSIAFIPGVRTLTLQASAATPAAPVTCQFNVVP